MKRALEGVQEGDILACIAHSQYILSTTIFSPWTLDSVQVVKSAWYANKGYFMRSGTFPQS